MHLPKEGVPRTYFSRNKQNTDLSVRSTPQDVELGALDNCCESSIDFNFERETHFKVIADS